MHAFPSGLDEKYVHNLRIQVLEVIVNGYYITHLVSTMSLDNQEQIVVGDP